MVKKISFIFLSAIVASLFFFSCIKEKVKGPTGPEFDRKAMLTNVAENIIIPNYLVLQTEANSLNAAVTQFNATADSINLVAVRIAFAKVYKAWQLCSVFEFGPAETELLRANLNIFPTDTVQIKSNISSGTYDLAAASNLDAKGFPALDYLLFASEINNTLIMYTSDANAVNRKIYLVALSNEIKTKVNSVYNSWIASGGNYINTFINNTGTDVGSSVGALVNQLNYDFETLKNFKIGIPLGKKTLGTPLPAKVEGYFGKNSVQLAVDQLKTIENIYLGRSMQGVDGLGLDDYLIHLSSPYNGGMLSDAIKSQFTNAIIKLQNVADPLSQTIISNPSVVDAAYLELQKQVVLLKTDMPSSLGVLITYQDNDGD